ncbi:PREDICTED: putative nuclease HARBI1 [Rhagoletis zephyria]|uniref:putative nuclease HARBI1 n=1 Tax=Rhagoletis zephyria TaxID=28612 RepID=UPI0008114CF0|nr:PREDICTED: putative nuclease HARBI1 [Rhagoletis zephyria]
MDSLAFGIMLTKEERYYSINAMIVGFEKNLHTYKCILQISYLICLQICDSKMRIRYVNAQYSGSNHDSHIWNVSNARYFFKKKYLDGERNTWLLGDAGYALEPWLMTPFRSPPSVSPEGNYNKVHAKARNIVERTIGVFKNRFRCLLGARELHYEPSKVCQIVNVAAALHKICIHYREEAKVNRKRVSNFTADEKAILGQLIKKRPIIESKHTDGKSILRKKEAWDLLTNEFNSNSNVYKSIALDFEPAKLEKAIFN